MEAAVGEDPASPKVQALAARWRKLIEGFTGGNREVQAGLNKLYADQANWPSTFKKPYSDAVGALMCQAMAIAKAEEVVVLEWRCMRIFAAVPRRHLLPCQRGLRTRAAACRARRMVERP